MLKKILLGLGLVVVLAVAGLAYLTRGLFVDHSSADYQSRIEYIWQDEMPHQPSRTEKAAIEADESWLMRRLQHYSRLPEGRPYVVAFPLEDSALSPAMIIAPGGAYLARAEGHEGIAVARWLNSLGVAAFVLNYRLDRHPAPLSDAQRAIQYVRANAQRLQIDPARVGIMGFSAGGHLAATAGTHYLAAKPEAPDPIERVSSRPDLLVLAYPVISMGKFTHATSRDMLLGPTPSAALIKSLSNETQVDAQTPPTFIWTAKTDGEVDYRNSQLFAAALEKHGVQHAYHLFPEGMHGTGLASEEKYAAAWPGLCEQWFRSIGFLPHESAAYQANPQLSRDGVDIRQVAKVVR